MKSKRFSFKQMGGILSASAVALSLVFVGLEVRETAEQTKLNTEAVQLSAYQDLIAQIAQLNSVLLDPELAALYGRINGPNLSMADLGPVERVQTARIMYLTVRHADMAYYQYERGLLSEDRLESALAPFVGPLRNPIPREFWEISKRNFVPSFQAYIDSRIAEFDSED